MSVAVTSKGQVTIPIAIREALGIDAGSRVEFSHNERGEYVLTPVKKQAKKSAKSRFGILRGTGRKDHMGTSQLMQLLRGYDTDNSDPGFK